MTTNQLLLAVAAGLIAAVVFASATTGAAPLQVILYFLTALPLYLAALGIGPIAGLIASVTAMLAIALLNPVSAAIFGISTGVPAVIATRLALLGRQNENGQAEWYPIGRIVFASAMVGGMLAALVVLSLGNDTNALTKNMRFVVESFFDKQVPQVPGAPTVSEAQKDEIVAQSIAFLPYTIAALSMLTTLLNLWLSGRITLASGRLVRPWPELSALTLPNIAPIVLVVAMALSFMDGLPGMLAGAFAGATTFAFALVGLALIHALTRGSPWRNFVLAALYLVLVLNLRLGSVALALAGLAETIFHYRARGDDPPPSNADQR